MKVGEFSMELINAETKEPMKEFTAPDGKVYIEAEPDLEYFIRCHRERGISYSTFSNPNDTMVELEVDDACLGYHQPFSKISRDLGLWKCQNGVNTFQALKMILKRTRKAAGGPAASSNNMPPTGKVKATFHELTYSDEMVQQIDVDRTNCLDQSAIAQAVASGTKKAFASVTGSASISRKDQKWYRRRIRGRYLGDVTIYYTSALGLSQLGILAPIVDAETTTHREDSSSSLPTEPRRKRVKTESEVRLVSPSVSRSVNDVIDLTGDD